MNESEYHYNPYRVIESGLGYEITEIQAEIYANEAERARTSSVGKSSQKTHKQEPLKEGEAR